MNEAKRIQDIQEAYGQQFGRILNGLLDKYPEIAKEKPEAVGFFDRLSDEQKVVATRDHRLALANEAREKAREDYNAAFAEYRERVESRKAEAETALFGHGDALSADVLARASFASNEELLAMAKVATKTGNASLKQATLSVAAERELGDVLVETFSPEEQDLYAEITGAPPKEVLDRQTHAVDTDAVLPSPNLGQLMPPDNGTTLAA